MLIAKWVQHATLKLSVYIQLFGNLLNVKSRQQENDKMILINELSR